MNGSTWYALEPLDTLFLRNGQPFNRGEGGGIQVEGSFPPSPTTLVGALRAAMARAQGWGGHGPWPPEVRGLGNGADLGGLRFGPPVLEKDGEVYFPAPAHLMPVKQRHKLEGTVRFLTPGAQLHTDRGELRLPVAPQLTPDEKALEPGDYFVSASSLQALLEGRTIKWGELVHRRAFWVTEPRVGIQRTNRVTQENALYETRHVRLQKGVRLLVEVENAPCAPLSPLPLGGESRAAHAEAVPPPRWPQTPAFSSDEATEGKFRYLAVLISPVAIDELGEGWRRPGEALGGLPGAVVSACLGKPILIGGWFFRQGSSGGPQPLRPHLPAGSVFFLESPSLPPSGSLSIGNSSNWGYGHVLIGKWRSE